MRFFPFEDSFFMSEGWLVVLEKVDESVGYVGRWCWCEQKEDRTRRGLEEEKRDEEGTGGRGLGEFFSFPASVSWDAKREDLFARLDGGSDVPLYLRRPVQTPFLLLLLLYPLSTLVSRVGSTPLQATRSILPQPPLRHGFLPQLSLSLLLLSAPPTPPTSARAMVDHV